MTPIQQPTVDATSRRFAGKIVIVTGAGSGIGYEMAARFVSEGAVVFAADVIAGAPTGTEYVHTDVSNAGQVADLVNRVIDECGRIDILCNNAGIGSTTSVVDCSPEEWDTVFAVNARAVFLGTKYVLPHMLRKKSGAIVNTASVAGLIGFPDRAAYCASKGAVIALTKQVAVQYAQDGIRCNAICPGTVDSPWVGRLLAQSDDPKRARQRLIERQPMGRLGKPSEIAAAALFLASDECRFVTGEMFVIDGGILAS